MIELGSSLLPFEEFINTLKDFGKDKYHIHHPFHKLMVEGKLTPGQIRAWVVNRFYYQRILPMKDAAIISNCPFPEVRRIWIKRILNHDNYGIEMWIKLGEAVGLNREQIMEGNVLPAVRFAVDTYLNLCKHRSWIYGVATTLTELFAPQAIEERIVALKDKYPWIKPESFEYFEWRLSQKGISEDFSGTINILKSHVKSPKDQMECIEALSFKLDLLWSLLDAVYYEYILKNDGKTPYD
ncbi:MAG: pyrroloquinoline-quinone synthase PqqC [Hydrogenobacter thermophilus]|uniref:pyrroloquinoline-quinone synthase PqqC n=1 Tax=Hydrogenobacter thermophilus TaxID=940 RepID=UPI001C77B484|nr:pyrroloquinoline-quinone synthase PqqC [Hydrogenobacter thermophilus]QWK20521.1 MAG: pyrroloquinoline-quinone synthase PqqC [Hydrogenobacter thermophilus]